MPTLGHENMKMDYDNMAAAYVTYKTGLEHMSAGEYRRKRLALARIIDGIK